MLETRAAVPSEFILGLKINAGDYAISKDDSEASPALDHVRTIASWGLVDFIEISGGDYEAPGKLPAWDTYHTRPLMPSQSS